jgi:hypothetical protein
LNFSAEIVPVADLAEAALGGVLFGESSAEAISESFLEVGGEFFDDFGTLVWFEGEGAELFVDEVAPIRHRPPW